MCARDTCSCLRPDCIVEASGDITLFRCNIANPGLAESADAEPVGVEGWLRESLG